jgi:hypothetical protein
MAEDPEQAGEDASTDPADDDSPDADVDTGDEQGAETGETAPDATNDASESRDSGHVGTADGDDESEIDESDGVTGPTRATGSADTTGPADATAAPTEDVPRDVRKYERFKKMDGAQYERVNDFLRDRTYITAREWAIARLCADFRTETGVEMKKIGENLPELVPFMTDTYTPQAVNQARSSFEEKIRKSGATFLYGAMCGFFTAEELDEMMYDVTEIAKFLLEVEGVDLSVEDELEAEERISSVMREVREASDEFRTHEAGAGED